MRARGKPRSCVGRPNTTPIAVGLAEHRPPLPELTRDLEELKRRLSDLEGDSITPEETKAMAREISAIRLQLKRLRFDQEAMRDAVDRLDG